MSYKELYIQTKQEYYQLAHNVSIGGGRYETCFRVFDEEGYKLIQSKLEEIDGLNPPSGTHSAAYLIAISNLYDMKLTTPYLEAILQNSRNFYEKNVNTGINWLTNKLVPKYTLHKFSELSGEIKVKKNQQEFDKKYFYYIEFEYKVWESGNQFYSLTHGKIKKSST